MLKTRVIPVVLWDGVNCVQTVKFGRPARIFGSLMDAVRLYEKRNVDELILLDIEAKNRSPRIEQVKQFTSELFCPVTVGGGIKTLDDIRDLLKAGADKVVIKSAARPEFIEQASRKFGSQAIVFALDAWDILSENIIKGVCMDAELAGVGEIILTSVPNNGTMEGYELPIIEAACNAVNIPIIAHGGCGKPEHMLAAIKAGAHAVAASTMFLFTETTPRDCTKYLAEHGIRTRTQ